MARMAKKKKKKELTVKQLMAFHKKKARKMFKDKYPCKCQHKCDHHETYIRPVFVGKPYSKGACCYCVCPHYEEMSNLEYIASQDASK